MHSLGHSISPRVLAPRFFERRNERARRKRARQNASRLRRMAGGRDSDTASEMARRRCFARRGEVGAGSPDCRLFLEGPYRRLFGGWPQSAGLIRNILPYVVFNVVVSGLAGRSSRSVGQNVCEGLHTLWWDGAAVRFVRLLTDRTLDHPCYFHPDGDC